MKGIVKHILFLLILAALFLPLVQTYRELMPEWELNGYAAPPVEPPYSRDSLLTGEYTAAYQNFTEHKIPFRGHFIRLRNQIYYSVFSIAKANAVVVGKNDVLLDVLYIDAYYGTDFAGEDFLREKLRKWKELEDTLRVYGVKTALVMAPGKASFFPDDFPDHLKREHAPWTNYKFIMSVCEAEKVTTIDLKAQFHSWNDTSAYPLFTKGGIHWSEYGALLAQLQLGKELERILGQKLDSVPLRLEFSTDPRGTDNDIERGMNLLFDLPRDTLAYAVPLYHEKGIKPKVLAIGDSYYWNLFGNGFADRMCSHGGFWYYFKEAHPSHLYGNRPVEALNLREEVLKNQVLMLMMTEPQLPRFGWDSVEALHKEFCIKKN